MEPTHIASRFDRDVARIERLLQKMAGLVGAQLAAAREALERGDGERAREIARRDREINRLEVRIDELSLRLIALRQPMAEDLRRAVSTLKVSNNLERIGDYAKIMALRVAALSGEAPAEPALRTIGQMTGLVVEMLDQAMRAYLGRDAALAESTRLRDADVDRLNNALFRDMLSGMLSDAGRIEAGIHLLFISKNLERAGDRIGNITEQATFLITGEIFENRD